MTAPTIFDSYLWSTGETTPTIEVTTVGEYTLMVSDGPGCTDEATYVVTELPELDINIQIADFRTKNTVVIDVTGSPVPLVYSINGGVSFQTSNRFNTVSPGVKTIIIQDEAGCLFETRLVIVRGTPAFFTPNSDGFNDCLLYTSPSPRDQRGSRMPSSA